MIARRGSLTRTLAELSLETRIDPERLLELGDGWIATFIDVLEERAEQMKK